MKLRRFLALFLTFVLIFPLFGCTETVPEGSVTVWLPQNINYYNNIEPPERKVYTYRYDGNLVKYTKYIFEQFRLGYDYFYDDYGAAAGWEMTGRRDDDASVYFKKTKYHYDYNDGGQIIGSRYEYVNNFGNESIFEYTYTYHNNGSERREFDEDGLLSHIAKFDEAGRTIEIINYTGRAEQISTEKYREYDADGRLLKETYINDDHTYVDEWYFDNSGKLLVQTASHNGVIYHQVRYTYDEAGHPAEMVEYDDGIESFREKYTVDDRGLVVKKDIYYPNGHHTEQYITYTSVFVTPERAIELQKWAIDNELPCLIAY